jgi:nuclear pore complex protein Nup85
MNSIDHHLNLFPSLIQVGHAEQFTQSGKTLLFAQSPLNQSYAVFPSARKDVPSTKTSGVEEQPIFFASSETLPSSERRLFIGDTSIIFAALQNLTNTAQNRGQEWLHSQETHDVIRKLTLDYVNFTRECWIHTSQTSIQSQGSSQFSGDHYRSLYTCLALFAVLYVPEYGYEDAPVGDDLMEWLNVHFIEPSTEEGDHLSGLDRPWEDETFWPYLVRVTLRGLSKAATFFLATLSTHPSGNLRRLAQRLSPLLQSQPHLQSFEAERDFAYASHRWKDKVKALRIELDSVSESDRHDGIENWWDRLSDIVGILEGRLKSFVGSAKILARTGEKFLSHGAYLPMQDYEDRIYLRLSLRSLMTCPKIRQIWRIWYMQRCSAVTLPKHCSTQRSSTLGLLRIWQI